MAISRDGLFEVDFETTFVAEELTTKEREAEGLVSLQIKVRGSQSLLLDIEFDNIQQRALLERLKVATRSDREYERDMAKDARKRDV